MTIDERILAVRAELEELRTAERNTGRLFFTAIPGLVALGTLILYLNDHDPKLLVLIVPLALLSLAAATNLVRFAAPHRFTDIHERIARKEGELAALEKKGS